MGKETGDRDLVERGSSPSKRNNRPSASLNMPNRKPNIRKHRKRGEHATTKGIRKTVKDLG